MTGCATPKAHDGKVDTCNLTKPPKEARKYETHAALLLGYPDKIPNNYTGCHATWLAESAMINGVEQLMKSHLLLMLKLNGGKVSRVELHEPHEDTIVCEFNKNQELTLGSAEVCMPYSRWQPNEELINND